MSEPEGSELAPPAKRSATGQTVINKTRDPHGRLHRDKKGMIDIESVVTPARVKPGHRVRVRVTFRPNEKTRPYWNNEADDLAVWVDLPKGSTMTDGQLGFPNPAEPETREVRAVEFEIMTAEDSEAGTLDVPIHAAYLRLRGTKAASAITSGRMQRRASGSTPVLLRSDSRPTPRWQGRSVGLLFGGVAGFRSASVWRPGCSGASSRSVDSNAWLSLA